MGRVAGRDPCCSLSQTDFFRDFIIVRNLKETRFDQFAYQCHVDYRSSQSATPRANDAY